MDLTSYRDLEDPVDIETAPSRFAFFLVVHLANADDIRIRRRLAGADNLVKVTGVEGDMAFGAVFLDKVNADKRWSQLGRSGT